VEAVGIVIIGFAPLAVLWPALRLLQLRRRR
jgi:hypothetical protein